MKEQRTKEKEGRVEGRDLEDEEEETRKKTGNEMEPPNAYLGIACLLVAPLVLPVSFYVFLLPFYLPFSSLRSSLLSLSPFLFARAEGRKKEEEDGDGGIWTEGH